MKFLKGYIQSYGRLKQFPLEFPSSFILVFGGNETGKSTLQSFLKNMLCGMKDRGKKGNIRHPEFQRFQPWETREKNDSIYGGQLTLQCRSGEVYEIQRNFVHPEADHIHLLTRHEDLTRNFQDEQGLFFLEKRLNASAEILEGIYCLPQILMNPAREKVQHALHHRFSLRFDSTPEKETLLRALHALKLEQEQTTRAIEIEEQHLKELSAKREEMKKILHQIHILLSRCSLLRREQISLTQQFYSIYQELKRIRHSVEDVRDFPAEFLPFLREQSALLANTLHRHQQLQLEKNSLNQKIARVAEQLHSHKKWEGVQEKELVSVHIALEEKARIEAIYKEKVKERTFFTTSYEEKSRKLQELEVELGSDPLSALKQLERLVQEREAYKLLESQAEEKQREIQHEWEVQQLKIFYCRFGWIIPIILVAGALWFFMELHPLIFMLLGGTGVMSALAFLWMERFYERRGKSMQEQLRKVEQEVSTYVEEQTARGVDLTNLLHKACVKSPEEFYAKVREYSVLQAEVRAFTPSILDSEIARLESTLNSLDEKIKEFSSKLGLSSPLTLSSHEEIEREYLLITTARQEWLQFQAQLKTLSEQLAHLELEQKEYEKMIQETLKKTGVADVASFEEQVQRKNLYWQTASLLEEFQDFYFQYAENDKMKREEAEGDVRWRNSPPSALGERLKTLQKAVWSLENEWKEMEHQRQILEGQYEPAQEVEERIYSVEERVKHLQHKWKILQRGTELLEGVKQELESTLSPRVNVAFTEIIKRLTFQRYRSARVQENLRLALKSSEKKGWVSAEDLSTGALAVTVLALRLAFAEVLQGENEPLPFLMDDPLVHFDDARAEEAIKFLASWRSEYQIFYFTCHEREKALIQKFVPDAWLILTPPV